MPERIPITPSVLKWARERSGYTVEELIKYFKYYENWESGESFPTYNQLESLSDKFKCPIAVFFFPEPPEIEPIENSFRTLPDVEFEYMPRSVRMILRKARAMQLNLMELHEGKNPARRFIIRDLHLSLDQPISELASEVRAYLGTPLEEQISWDGIDEAFDNWRKILTAHGVYVFKDAFRDVGFSGICLYDNEFPIIFVNNTNVRSRQIFTLFHELAHLLFHTSGIDKVNDSYIRFLQNQERRIEIFCNQFAGAFLVPDADFLDSFLTIEINEPNISILADRYHVSREVILRKFLDNHIVTQEYYDRKSRDWADQITPSGTGGDYYYTQITYLGQPYIELALNKYHQKKIDAFKLGDYLNIKPKYLEKFEEKYNAIE